MGREGERNWRIKRILHLFFKRQYSQDTVSAQFLYEEQPSSPRGGAPKSFPVERSPVRDNFPGPVRSERRREKERDTVCGRREEKRREKRGEKTGWGQPRRAEARPSEQESPERRSLGASPWLRSVPGYGQLFFTLRANDRYVFSFQGWTYPFVGGFSPFSTRRV